MDFKATSITGVMIVESAPIRDIRGDFSRSYCAQTFEKAGLPPLGVQCNISSNHLAGTLRGLHFQAEPSPDPKLVRCIAGRIFDVAVDLRRTSPSFGRWTGVELGGDDGRAIFVPPGCAHGFLTLEAGSKVLYMMGADYEPDLARGVRWDDPDIAIAWPSSPIVISDRDRSLPGLREVTAGAHAE